MHVFNRIWFFLQRQSLGNLTKSSSFYNRILRTVSFFSTFNIDPRHPSVALKSTELLFNLHSLGYMNAVPCRHCGWLVLRYSTCFFPISLANLVKILKVILIRIGDVMSHGVPRPWSGVSKNMHHRLHHQKLLCLGCWPLGKALGREESTTIVIQCEKWKVKVLVSVMSDSLWPHGLWPTKAPLVMEFSRQEY